jgi:flagellar biogenesis protein FliO
MSDGWGQTIIALGGVILLIFGVAQVFKRLARTQGGLAGQLGAGGTAPSGILEVIGRYPITTGLTLVVLKFDRRVLLVASSAATRGKHAKGASMQTLCELSDPEDVASILLKSRSASGESIAQSFERALRDADDFTDDSIYRYEQPIENAPRPRATRASAPRTITSDEGDRAELWSGGNDGQAAARVLRERLANMRPGTRSA